MSETLQDLRDDGLTWREIAAYLNVSERTVYRRNARIKDKRRKSKLLPDIDRADALALTASAPCAGVLDAAFCEPPARDIARTVWLRDNYCAMCPVRIACDAVIQPVRTGWDGLCAGEIYSEGRPMSPGEVGRLFAANVTRSQLVLFDPHPSEPAEPAGPGPESAAA